MKDPRPGEGWGGVIRTDRDTLLHWLHFFFAVPWDQSVGLLTEVFFFFFFFSWFYIVLCFSLLLLSCFASLDAEDQYGGLTSLDGMFEHLLTLSAVELSMIRNVRFVWNLPSCCLPEAYRMPLPADVDEFKIPDFKALGWQDGWVDMVFLHSGAKNRTQKTFSILFQAKPVSELKGLTFVADNTMLSFAEVLVKLVHKRSADEALKFLKEKQPWVTQEV